MAKVVRTLNEKINIMDIDEKYVKEFLRKGWARYEEPVEFITPEVLTPDILTPVKNKGGRPKSTNNTTI